MLVKEFTISDATKKLFLLAIVIGVMFAMMGNFVFSFHPGRDRDGTVPQGPHQTACDNEGRQGIDKAIANGGQVHCDCTEIPHGISINDGACLDISAIDEIGIPQCCTTETPRGVDCGADAEWVVGVTALPVCFISGS